MSRKRKQRGVDIKQENVLQAVAWKTLIGIRCKDSMK
jgi:hypothetical protein